MWWGGNTWRTRGRGRKGGEHPPVFTDKHEHTDQRPKYFWALPLKCLAHSWISWEQPWDVGACWRARISNTSAAYRSHFPFTVCGGHKGLWPVTSPWGSWPGQSQSPQERRQRSLHKLSPCDQPGTWYISYWNRSWPSGDWGWSNTEKGVET